MYNCIQDWTGTKPGTGNIGDDPMFVRPPDDGGDGWGDGINDDYGDLHLMEGSPCIDAGDNTNVPPDTEDLDHDQLCRMLADVFLDFLDMHRKGQDARILDRLDAMKIGVFS